MHNVSITVCEIRVFECSVCLSEQVCLLGSDFGTNKNIPKTSFISPDEYKVYAVVSI
jgi:hypothetical protein